MAARTTTFATIPQEINRVREGTQESGELETCVRQHARFVFKVAYGVLRNSHDAEDVVQEVFLRVHCSGTRGVRDMQSWLATIAFRLAVDRRRPEAVDVADIEIATSESGADAIAAGRQTLERVHRLIAALPDELRFPLILTAIEELNSRQVAEVLGIPESSVRGRVMRARQLLKEKLAAITDVKP